MKIKNSPSGKIVATRTGYEAFKPHPLPPQIEWDDRLVRSLSRADLVIGKLAGQGSRLQNPHLLIRPFITREAVLSSKIEGTQATISEVLAHEAGALVERSPDDLKEVNNYINAVDYGVARLDELPISLRLIKELHEKLMTGVRGEHATPGKFRTSQNWIGPSGCTLLNAKYVPPTPDDLMECLSAFEFYMHEAKVPALIQIALCHYQFEAIHPFLDGNGRVGRLLITLLLIQKKILPSPLLYLSAFFEATRSEYYQQLFNVSAFGSWHDWLIYFLNGVAIQARDALSRTQRINDILEEWLMQVAGSSTALPSQIVQLLTVNPYLTIQKVADHFGVAYTTAQRSIQRLQDLNIVTQVTQSKRGRVYCAIRILSILEEPALVNHVESDE